MSATCGNCDCGDKSQKLIITISSFPFVFFLLSYMETVVMEAAAAEHNGKCKCGASCTCVDCTCGH
ncbi:hypothetical protein Fmac_021080 [Flemingia macrophylla]|uniref:Metallothionein n=1 Tax=Flemingia macrophylla TaxID=520843 RepID=A0ABD1LVV6_9FABA